MSFRLETLNLWLRFIQKPQLMRLRDPQRSRDLFERQARRYFRPPADMHAQEDALRHDGRQVPLLWVSAGRPDRRRVLLYFHGGAFVTGSPRTHAALAGALSVVSGMRVALPAYRLAPDHPAPAALDDAEVCYRALLDAGYAPADIAFAGDSAGGGLALALLHRLLARSLPVPAALLLLSPWTDLTGSGDSVRRNAFADPTLPSARLPDIAALYAAGRDLTDPDLSPLFGTYTGAPPVMVQVGKSEILLDDSVRLARQLRHAGVDVRLDIWRKAPHGWQLFCGWLPEADEAVAQLGAFLRDRVGAPASSRAEAPTARATGS
ncbi:alpha/beta hydrolase fold domain-containing protein [Oceanomicrobium pacificus]|uniref:Alpha/beta hydrolase fold domain-containing protein n=1 Tax=Oceanomicrobium pacificus TaxID=2692916 RepID=A0A6B0TU36_9RHOB|nr:alpha/beta hydrolase fold domain-containing protein [Oceanomicrobium pacificus]MXU64473.1 alpha/beta hydrolase fold domain-containing protein [Oceanomicrobium pacificus]